jgi:SNF family Na+-dependent transporter
MEWVQDAITGWLKDGLVDAVMERVRSMFDSINTQIADVAQNVGQDPQSWNGSAFDMVRSLSETAILPIAGLILTFVLCYELIQMIIERNNMHSFEIYEIYKWLFKTICAVYILTHTFDIVIDRKSVV